MIRASLELVTRRAGQNSGSFLAEAPEEDAMGPGSGLSKSRAKGSSGPGFAMVETSTIPRSRMKGGVGQSNTGTLVPSDPIFHCQIVKLRKSQEV